MAPTASDVSSSSASPSSEVTTLEDEVTLLRDEATRARGLSALEHRLGDARDPQTRAAMAEAIATPLAEVWDDAGPSQSRILRLCLALEHPSLVPVWTRALGLDGSAAAQENTRLALDGIARASATRAVPSIISALEAQLAQPSLDRGEPGGEVRGAMIETLGALGDRRATPVLMSVLEQSVDVQPVSVHRKAAVALGRLGDPAAVDSLILVPYRVPDVPSTVNIGERAKTALVAIGEPAVPRVIDALEGRYEELEWLAARHGLDVSVVSSSAAMLLGALGSRSAVEPLLKRLPTGDCRAGGRMTPEDPDGWGIINMRAVVANALGLIGDERAVAPLCRCATASGNPGDMVPIMEALGRIGGSQATKCLARVVRKGRYHPDVVGSPQFEHESRWEAARFGLLAAGSSDRAVIEAAMKDRRQPETVVARMKPWAQGRAVLERCGDDPTCFTEVLGNPAADWFAREIAAINLARLSPGDAVVAERIAAAYSVRNPDARVTMAWLAAHVMQGKRCAGCAARLTNILEQEKDSRPSAQYQLSVLVARYSIARLREPVVPIEESR